MSFKREGDDKRLLGSQQRQRIQELLVEDIPEDEVKSLNNGRLTCVVCKCGPIFDTIKMLAIHRNGKKHLSYLGQFKRNKREIEQLKQKRKHEEYLSMRMINRTQVKQRKIDTHTPSNLNVKSQLVNQHDRRFRIDLTKTSKPVATELSSLPGNKQTIQDVLLNKQDGPLIHHNQLSKMLDKKKPEIDVVVRPYTSSRQTFTKVSTLESNDSVPSQFTNDVDRHSCVEPCESEMTNQPKHNSQQSRVKLKNDRKGQVQGCKSEKFVKAERFLQLRGAGWKRDWDGKWIKDEDAEFDSDEDEPPQLPQ